MDFMILKNLFDTLKRWYKQQLMTSSQSESRNLRKRERRAAERILDNSALRDSLNDEQAVQLQEWAFDHIAEQVKRTASLPDEDAQAAIEPTLVAVSRVMLAINNLIAQLSQEQSSDDAEQYITQYIKYLRRLQDTPADLYDRVAMAVMQTEPEKIFTALMDILLSNANKA